MSIKYDSTELENATYLPRYVHHETAPERLINSLKLARQDGEVIIDDTLSIKYIEISGILVGSSRSDLDGKIDAFKELISRKDKNLDVTWVSGIRRYVCRSITHEFNRDFYNILHVPYTIRFFVATGYGKDTSETTALNKTGIVAATDSEEVTLAGSYNPKPKHTINLDTRGNADIIRLENEDTGDYMDIDLGEDSADGIWDGDYIVVDEEDLTVKKNGTTAMEYRGKFPSTVIGANNLKMTIYGNGYTLDEYNDDNTGALSSVVWDNGTVQPWGMQSFVAGNSGRVKKLGLPIVKNGAPTGYAYFNLWTDDNGKPGTFMGTAYYRIAMTSIPSFGAIQWSDFLWGGTATKEPFLTKGKRYWIVNYGNQVTGSDVSKYLMWPYSNLATSYLYGKAMAAKIEADFLADILFDGIANAGAGDGVDNGQYNCMFRVYLGDGAAVSHDIDWEIKYTKKYL